MKRISIIFMTLFFMSSILSAQNESVGYWAISGLFATGDFGDADANYNSNRLNWGLLKKEDKGGAGMGLGLNLGLWLAPPNVGGMKFGFDIMYSYWWMNSEIRDFYNDYEDDISDHYSHIKDLEIRLPHYNLAPFTFGLRYDLGAFHISGGAGFCMNMISEKRESWRNGGKNYYSTITYDINMFSFAWRIGAGIKISDNVSLIASYYSMGALKIKGKAVASGASYSSSEFELDEIHPTAFSVTLAFSLNKN